MGRGRYINEGSVGRYSKGGNVTGSNPKMKIMTINVPEPYIKYIEKFIEYGLIPSRSEWIRTAMKEQIREDLYFIETLEKETDNFDPKKYVRIPNGDGTYKSHKIVRRLE